jgi:hypothetical protein
MKGLNEINEMEKRDYLYKRFDPENNEEACMGEEYTWNRESAFEDPDFVGDLMMLVGIVLENNPRWISLAEISWRIEWAYQMVELDEKLKKYTG